MKFFLNIFFTKMVNLLLKTLQIHFCSKFTLCPTAWWPCSCHQRIPDIFVKKYWEVVVMNYTILFEKKYVKRKNGLSPWKLFNVSWLPWMGRNFDHYPGFQQRARGTQNYENHCMNYPSVALKFLICNFQKICKKHATKAKNLIF